MRRGILGYALLAFAASAPTLGAQEIGQRIEIHGFGSWNSGAVNNDNLYLGAKKQGSSKSSVLALNVSGQLSDQLTFTTQVKFNFDGTTQPGLDYVFAQWKFNDALKLRAGQVKQPFGIYTEVMDVGTLRPFLALPQSVYGPVAIVAEAYRGIGFTGSLVSYSGWGVDYDVYAGGLNRKEYEQPMDMYRALQGRRPIESVSDETEEEVTDRLYGGRLNVLTPLTGLKFGSSAYKGETFEAGFAGAGTITVLGAHLEYIGNRATVRSEWTYEYENDTDAMRAIYTEASYRVFGNWRVAGMYDRLRTHAKGTPPTRGLSLLNHQEFAGGLSYHFSPQFVMKASYHHVEGNRLALPGLDQTIERLWDNAQELDPRTNAVLLGAQFSF